MECWDIVLTNCCLGSVIATELTIKTNLFCAITNLLCVLPLTLLVLKITKQTNSSMCVECTDNSGICADTTDNSVREHCEAVKACVLTVSVFGWQYGELSI